jgi:TPR repeat protein
MNLVVFGAQSLQTARECSARQEWVAAYHLYAQAAKLGNVKGQVLLALCYTRGIGVTADPLAAKYWLEVAAMAGQATAQYNLGLYYQRYEEWISARYWYSLSAAQGFRSARTNLARCWYYGLGGRRDHAQAAQLYGLAAAAGCAKAAYALGRCYEHGHGVFVPDLRQALVYYEQAAVGTFKPAMAALARLGNHV